MSLNTDKLNGVDFTPKPAMPDIFWIAPNMSVSTKYIKADIIEKRIKVAAEKACEIVSDYEKGSKWHDAQVNVLTAIIREALSEKNTTISDK